MPSIGLLELKPESDLESSANQNAFINGPLLSQKEISLSWSSQKHQNAEKFCVIAISADLLKAPILHSSLVKKPSLSVFLKPISEESGLKKLTQQQDIDLSHTDEPLKKVA